MKRFLPTIFLSLLCAVLIAQNAPGFSLDELQLKRIDSKKKYPATVLRYEPDAYSDLVSAQIYKGKSLYTGNVVDEKDQVITNAVVEDGRIVKFTSTTPENSYRHSYYSSTNGKTSWYALDSVFYDGQLFTSEQYFQTPEGSLMQSYRIYDYDNFITEYSYRVGESNNGSLQFYEPVQHGKLNSYHNGKLIASETYRDGLIDGEIVEYDESGRLMIKYYVNAYIGMYGTYYEYDSIRNVSTVGHYNEKGVAYGQWISKYADSSIAAISYISPNGYPDSSKQWDQKGNLVNVEYDYWRVTKNPKPSDHIDYSRSWYSNGQLASFTNYNPILNDTIHCLFDMNGSPLVLERNYKGHVQRLTWYPNGKPESERYGVPSSVEGITVRDSIYREWWQNGVLKIEHSYVNGQYIVPGYDPSQQRTSTCAGPAYYAIMNNRTSRHTWDSCSVVPITVIDSVAAMIDEVYFTTVAAHDRSSDAGSEMRDALNTYNHDYPEIDYTIVLIAQPWVNLDAEGKVITPNSALNAFLDSLKIRGLGVAPLGNYSKKKGEMRSDFSVTTTGVHQYLNLFYINRRLNALAPGSTISIYRNPTVELPAEIIYVPAGQQTAFGVLTYSVIAITGSGKPSTVTSGNKTLTYDGRTFYLYHVYGDGEVEFARTADKSTVLKQYFGDKSGAILQIQ